MRRKIESTAISQHHSAEMLKLPDCIYLSETGKCKKLDIDYCQGNKCSFMASHNVELKAKSKWAQRISSLNEAKQHGIAKKYYGGTMPWKN